MQSDRYLRVVLTVIAACLVWVCARDVVIVKSAHATDEMYVWVANWPSTQGVKVRNWPKSLGE